MGEDVLAGASCTLESENKHMKKSFSVVLILLVVINLSVAETAFNGVRLADAKWKQDDARLTFSDNNKNMVVRVADRDFVTVPYDQLEL